MSIRYGERLFEGAQASLYKYEGRDEDPTESTQHTPRLEGDLVVKVMAARTCCPQGIAARLVSEEKRMAPEDLRVTYEAALEATAHSHPCVIPFLFVELDSSQTMLSIVMPRKAGTLATWLASRRAPVSERTLLYFAMQIGGALQDMHARGVCHLDLSLNNILVSSLGTDSPDVFVCDLESATLAGRKPSVNFTFEFSSPEREREPSPLCDVFSLGVILLAIGSRQEAPGIVANVPGLGNVTLNQAQLTPSRIAAVVRRDLKHYSEFVISIVTMMLNHDPTTRPQLPFLLENIAALQRHQGFASDFAQTSSGGPLITQFPYVCGPFELRKLQDAEARQVALYRNSLMYDVHATCAFCGVRRSYDKHNRTDCTAADGAIHLPSHVSPGSPTCLPSCEPILQQSLAQRPAAGCMMHYLYPASAPTTMSEDSSRRLETDLGCQLQLHGGFFFADASPPDGGPDTNAARPNVLASCLAVVALTPGPSSQSDNSATTAPLWFTAAQPWVSSCTAALYQAGRIHRDVPSAFGLAQAFCWILPGEEFKLRNGEPWIPAELGGFVFFFNSDVLIPNEKDRFFAVAPSAELLSRWAQSSGPSPSGAVSRFLSNSAAVLGNFGGALRTIVTTAARLTPITPHGSPTVPPTDPSLTDAPLSIADSMPPAALADPPTTLEPPEPAREGSPSPFELISAPESPDRAVPASPGNHDAHLGPLAVFSTFIPANVLKVELTPALSRPSVFRLPVTGEFGTCGETLYLSPKKVAELRIPSDVKYMCFCRVDESFPTDTGARQSSNEGFLRLLPHHGFVLLNIRFDPVGLLSLRVLLASDIRPDHRRGAERLQTVRMSASVDYGGELPPGEIAIQRGDLSATSDAVSQADPIVAASSASPSPLPTECRTRSVGGRQVPCFIGWNRDSCCFYVVPKAALTSVERRTFGDVSSGAVRWDVLQWASVASIH